MAFTMSEDDDFEDDDYEKDDEGADLSSFCTLGFLDMNKLWGTADWASQVKKDQDFTIFGLLEAEIVFNPNDTWNQHPAVDYNNTITKVHVSSPSPSYNFATLLCLE
jgi:hypothetical protein